MKDRYLEVTFRKGKLLAAYLYLRRRPYAQSVRSEEGSPGLIVDFDAAGSAIGVEITSPGSTTASQINALLTRLNLEPVYERELAPLKAA